MGCEKWGGVMSWDVVCCDELWKKFVIFVKFVGTYLLVFYNIYLTHGPITWDAGWWKPAAAAA